MNRILLVDTYAQIYRAFYAVRSLTTKSGRPTNAVFAMARFLLKLHAEFPDYDGAFVSDLGKPVHRTSLAPDYKANRPPAPPELKEQIPVIRELIQAFGWRFMEQETWEADDLISALTRAFPHREFRIISADKDLAQLVNDRVAMLIPSHDGKGFELRDVSGVEAKFGVPPERIIDYLALIGDSADNIPGIEGVGPKTAARLIHDCGCIESMLNNPQSIEKETLRCKICGSSDLLRKNVKLIELLVNPPQGAEWDDRIFTRKSPDFNRIRSIADDLELAGIVRDVDRIAPPENDVFSCFHLENQDVATNKKDMSAPAADKNAPQAQPVQLELF